MLGSEEMTPGFGEIEVTFRLRDGQGTPDYFEAFLDQVMDEADKIGQFLDITATLSAYRAIFAAPIDNPEAMFDFIANVRTALHAADCGTPGWELERFGSRLDQDVLETV